MPQETSTEQICCPQFDPAPWDKQTINWDNKLFIKDSIRTFFHIPLPSSVGKVMERLYKKAETDGAVTDTKDFLCLAYDPTAWKCEYYMAVNKEVPDAENVKLSGTFLTRVFDGPYSAVPKWMKEMDKYVAEQGKKVIKYYCYYTTCPKCAKKYGHNYVVMFAQVG